MENTLRKKYLIPIISGISALVVVLILAFVFIFKNFNSNNQFNTTNHQYSEEDYRPENDKINHLSYSETIALIKIQLAILDSEERNGSGPIKKEEFDNLKNIAFRKNQGWFEDNDYYYALAKSSEKHTIIKISDGKYLATFKFKKEAKKNKLLDYTFEEDTEKIGIYGYKIKIEK